MPIKLGEKFHSLVREFTHIRILRSNLERYFNPSMRSWYLALPQTASEDIDTEMHQEVCQTIAAEDADTL